MYSVREFFIEDSFDRTIVKDFLAEFALKLPEDIEYSIGVYDGSRLVGVGSLGRSVIKGVAILDEYQGQAILAKIITELLNRAVELGYDHIFVYTKPDKEQVFKNLGFKKVGVSNKEAILLEWGGSIEDYLAYLSREKSFDGPAAAIVMNANPFTLGHRYLVEKALENSDFLYVFLVEEDRSEFPYRVRKRLVEEGLKGLENIKLVTSSKYAVSQATFPSYFTKEEDLARVQASLDLDIFINKIAKTLNINKRFIGEEPFSQVTNTYNQVMKEKLPPAGIDVFEIPRLEYKGQIISASYVRDSIARGEIEKLKNFLPASSLSYIEAEVGRDEKE